MARQFSNEQHGFPSTPGITQPNQGLTGSLPGSGGAITATTVVNALSTSMDASDTASLDLEPFPLPETNTYRSPQQQQHLLRRQQQQQQQQVSGSSAPSVCKNCRSVVRLSVEFRLIRVAESPVGGGGGGGSLPGTQSGSSHLHVKTRASAGIKRALSVPGFASVTRAALYNPQAFHLYLVQSPVITEPEFLHFFPVVPSEAAAEDVATAAAPAAAAISSAATEGCPRASDRGASRGRLAIRRCPLLL